ncbi:MAG: DUF72 domain-containing protein [Spirochaetaceae bacterium]|nr:MAG: DUF72 domain-containing protein [Spirochaetaceae bacterium]
MAVIRIGTASWTDPSLIKCRRYYPPGCNSAEARLRFYASQFPLVEVDSSYYVLPSERNSRLWIERTPADFLFNIKAFRVFTGHRTALQALPADLRAACSNGRNAKDGGRDAIYYRDLPREIRAELWARFSHAIGPLQQAGKLGSVLLQFAPWVVPGPRVFDHIRECRERLARFEVAVEFRHRRWQQPDSRESAVQLLRELKICHVAVDEPQGFEFSVRPHTAVTGRYALVRFHGRNRATWLKPGLASSAERFDYYYTEAELAEWLPRIEFMRSRASEVHLLFNTNNQDQGPVNARLLYNLLGEGLKEGS